MSPERSRRGVTRRSLRTLLGVGRTKVWEIGDPGAFAEPTTTESRRSHTAFLENLRNVARKK